MSVLMDFDNFCRSHESCVSCKYRNCDKRWQCACMYAYEDKFRDMEVTLLQPGDIPSLLTLLEKDDKEYTEKKIRAFMKGYDGFIFIIRDKGQVIGTGIVDIVTTPFEKFGVISTLFVSKHVRHVGLGRKLVEAIYEKCREKKCNFVCLTDVTTESEVYQFFKDVGFDSAIGFKKTL